MSGGSDSIVAQQLLNNQCKLVGADGLGVRSAETRSFTQEKSQENLHSEEPSEAAERKD